MRWKFAQCAMVAPFIALAITSCSGGGANGVVPASNAPNAPARAPTTTSKILYVGNSLGRTVVAFDASATGNVAPLFSVTGPVGCDFGGVVSVAVDSSDTLYVADGSGFIDLFKLSSGISPTFVGDFPVIQPFQIALDASNDLYVSNQSADDTGAISEYARNSSGVFSRVAVIIGPATDLLSVVDGVAIDNAGDIYASTSSSFVSSIVVYPPHSNGNIAPIRKISGPSTLLSAQPFGIAVDGTGKLYVANLVPASITVYAAGANGDVAPIQNISGPNTTLHTPMGVTVDASGKIYVADLRGSQSGDVAVFAPGANGNVAPIAVISGPDTGLAGPAGLAVH